MDHSSPPAHSCPRCGSPLPLQAPEGLCPICLGALNFTAETAGTGEKREPEPLPTPEALAPHFPQLEIIACLGRGGMGVVYQARQKSLGRLVALKLLAPEREKDAAFAERFIREARALAALNHPHIVTVYDFGRSQGYYFLLMEYVDGVNLRELLRARKLTPEEALAIVPPLCEALQYAHERGIVHRDIKPENLLLDKAGRIKIADFGIAKMLGPEGPAADDHVAGTPGYMAPEQKLTPPRADSRADIYSLGVVFYEMLTGELPTADLQPPSRKVTIDVRIDAVVLRALERAPEMRWQTAAEMRTGVEALAAAPAASGEVRAEPKAGEAASRPWNPGRQRVFWAALLLLAYPLAQLNLLMLRWYAPQQGGHSYGPSLGLTLLSANAVILCLALDLALLRSLWEWAHVTSKDSRRIWTESRRWWVTALACAILPCLLLLQAPRLAPPSILTSTIAPRQPAEIEEECEIAARAERSHFAFRHGAGKGRSAQATPSPEPSAEPPRIPGAPPKAQDNSTPLPNFAAPQGLTR